MCFCDRAGKVCRVVICAAICEQYFLCVPGSNGLQGVSNMVKLQPDICQSLPCLVCAILTKSHISGVMVPVLKIGSVSVVF